MWINIMNSFISFYLFDKEKADPQSQMNQDYTLSALS